MSTYTKSFLFTCCIAFVNGQLITVQQYIDTYKDLAINEMKRTGVPASITIAQGILETESGNSWLVLKSNNHFGIKCKLSWRGETVYHDDDEQGECFRKYSSAEESYRDHSDFLRASERYASLFSLDDVDYIGWAHGLKKAGYATNPKYPQMLIRSIEKYNLHQFTLQGKQDMIFEKEPVAVIKNENSVILSSEKQLDDKEKNNVPTYKKTTFLGIPAVFAPKNTSLLAIAIEHDIPLAKLLDYNDFIKDGLLEKEQWIYLDRKHKEGASPVYIVKGRESLHEVAQLYAVQVKYLEEYNRLTAGASLLPGTKIFLQPGQQTYITKEVQLQQVHNVLPKEGLYAISKKYNVSVAEIKSWNKLESDNLKVGQQLIILK
jgi:LysM repeat protein